MSRRHVRTPSANDDKPASNGQQIKCDRGEPCANCRDVVISCRRERQRLAKKPKDSSSAKIIQPIQHLDTKLSALDGRLASMERLITSFVKLGEQRNQGSEPLTPTSHQQPPLAANSTDSNNVSEASSKKRKLSKDISSPQRSAAPYHHLPSATPGIVQAPYSATEAQRMIRHELEHNHKLSEQKRGAFSSALTSLRESLRYDHADASNTLTAPFPSAEWVVPSLETVQWMLMPTKVVDLIWSLPDGLPILTRKTLVDMALEIQDRSRHDENAARIICVNSSVSYFLYEFLAANDRETGLEDHLREQIIAYSTTTQAALTRINPLSSPSLPTLQALIFGAVNAQEAGDAMASWNLTAAACSMCIALGLHMDSHSSSDLSSDSYSSSRFCLFVCYVNDKGLAMNLGRPPCLPDNHIQINLREVVQPTIPAVRQYLQNVSLELAIAQSCIIDLQIRTSRSSQADIIAASTATMTALDNAWEMIQTIPEQFSSEVPRDDLEYEFILARFSFYAIKTVLYHSCPMIHGSTKRSSKEALLESARASLREMEIVRDLCRRANFNAYKVNSFAHCIVLYYPFTAYFVLFCNIIVAGDQGDYRLVDGFLQYLVELKDTSQPFEKLYKLCLPFHTLASSVTQSPVSRPLRQTRPESHPHRPYDEERVLHAEIQAVEAGYETQDPRQQQLRHSMLGGAQLQPPAIGPPPPYDTASQSGAFSNPAMPHPFIGGRSGGGETVPTLNFGNGPMGDCDNSLTTGDYAWGSDDIFNGFMDEQPLLQWLDSDFSTFDEAWARSVLQPR